MIAHCAVAILEAHDNDSEEHPMQAQAVPGESGSFPERPSRGQDAALVVPGLIQTLTDPVPRVRSQAAAGLGHIGAPARDAVPVLIQALGDTDANVRVHVAEALGKIKADPEHVVPCLLRALRDEHERVRSFAAAALGRFGGEASSAVASLLKALDDVDWNVRVHAAAALGRIGGATERVVRRLIERLNDEHERVRSHSAAALGALGAAARSAVPPLLAALGDEDGNVRAHAAAALGRIRRDPECVIPRLAENLSDEHERTGSCAAVGLDAFGASTGGSAPRPQEAPNADDSYVGAQPPPVLQEALSRDHTAEEETAKPERGDTPRDEVLALLRAIAFNLENLLPHVNETFFDSTVDDPAEVRELMSNWPTPAIRHAMGRLGETGVNAIKGDMARLRRLGFPVPRQWVEAKLLGEVSAHGEHSAGTEGCTVSLRAFVGAREAVKALLADVEYQIWELENAPAPGTPSAKLRVFVEDIDSFDRIKNVAPRDVAHRLRNGHVDLLEDTIKEALVSILAVPLKPRDHGGEKNDLLADVTLRGERVTAAFVLKGRGTRGQLTIKKCGDDGGQIVRLFDAPAELFVVQHVGPVHEELIRDLEQKTQLLSLCGHRAWYCIIDGQDTARLLQAYGHVWG